MRFNLGEQLKNSINEMEVKDRVSCGIDGVVEGAIKGARVVNSVDV